MPLSLHLKKGIKSGRTGANDEKGFRLQFNRSTLYKCFYKCIKELAIPFWRT